MLVSCFGLSTLEAEFLFVAGIEQVFPWTAAKDFLSCCLMMTDWEHLIYAFHTEKVGSIHMLHRWDVGGFFLRCTLGCVLLIICLFFCGIFKVSEPSLPPRILLGHSQEVTSIAWCPSDFTKVCLLQNDLYCETIDEMWQHVLFKMAAGFVVLGKNF